MDVLSIYICPLGAGLAGIMFFWVCGKKYVEEQVNLGREKKFTDKFLPICKYIYCPICILVRKCSCANSPFGLKHAPAFTGNVHSHNEISFMLYQ